MIQPTSQYSALIVDDEPLVRQIAARALTQVGFRCQQAADGHEGLELAKASAFDLVVTDLRMPHANGHSLAVSLLELKDRPAIFVVTAVSEPKLANDLTARGVDEVLFKPTDYGLLATKAKAVIDRRQAARWAAEAAAFCARRAASAPLADSPAATPEPARRQPAGSANSSARLAANVSRVAGSLPNSPPDFDPFKTASAGKFGTGDLAVAIERDPQFAVEVLRLVQRIVFSSDETIRALQNTLGSGEARMALKHPALWSLVVFAAGVLLGAAIRSFNFG